MEIDDYLPSLEEELGEITAIKEWAPGVYDLMTGQEGPPWTEYLVVLDTSPIAAKVQNYGKKMDTLRLFDQADDFSGWRIVQYESSKYTISFKNDITPEWIFRDMSLHAMELHPEYFGTFPVPFHTPHGCTLRYRTLSNGIYWLETSKCEELLSICFPIWSAELSPAAVVHGEMLGQDRKEGVRQSTSYLFFPKKASCIPLYELMETRKEWEGTAIDRSALMNAIWEFMPQYAMSLNGQKDVDFKAIPSDFRERTGIDPLPRSDGRRVIGMYPGAGTEFLLLK